MSIARLMPAIVVLVIGGFLVGTTAISGEKDTAEYTIIIKKVEVHKTKADGSAWDIMDGKPDLVVKVQNTSVADSKPFQTKEETDSFTADYNTPTDIKVKLGQNLRFTVLDKDIAADDEIGVHNMELTKKHVDIGKLRIENFGRVIFLEFELKKL